MKHAIIECNLSHDTMTVTVDGVVHNRNMDTVDDLATLIGDCDYFSVMSTESLTTNYTDIDLVWRHMRRWGVPNQL